MKTKPCYRIRSDGLIEYRFSTPQGRKSVYGSTIKECDLKADKLKQRLSEGLKINANKITFKEYCEEFLEGIEKTVKPSTIFSYKKKIKSICRFIGDKKLVDLDRRDIVSLQKQCSEQFNSSTTNYYITLVRHILNSAVADRIISYNPCVNIKAIQHTEEKARDTIHRALTQNEQKLFFEYAKTSWYYELFCFMVATGVRVGEAGALTWSDIDNSNIHIHSTVTNTGSGQWSISTTKTQAGTRIIPLNATIKNILNAQRTKVAECVGITYMKPNCRIFYPQTNFNEPIKASMVTHAIDAVLRTIPKDLRMDHFTSHAFRDTFATRAAEQGIDMNTLKELLGHTKISITMDLYAHVLPDTKTAAMNKIKMVLG